MGNDKCKVMHMGRRNGCHQYTLNGVLLGKSGMEDDLGVLVDCRFNWSNQCQSAAAKANKVLWCIKRGIGARDENIILPLYKALVRPHMEYCVQFWSPVLRKDVIVLEGFQRRATKLIYGMRERNIQRGIKTGIIYPGKKTAKG
ncbi:hypothetical protein GDO78_019678 [Eleutherodactylus coqui]|uniref:Uncharacterized protein n=1 Tax=Eleutherodactylus coqui TaxID=57060 RepID=A0A8J6EIE7_ELECQ|nr:hypothetical protein GDO78_019678 [Eleutherodactylus coqui]